MRRWWLPITLIALGVLGYLYIPRGYCRSAEERYGLRLERCPDGVVRQVVRLQVRDLSRGGGGTVLVSPEARYAVAKADDELAAPIASFKTQLFLVDAAGEETRLKPEDKWEREEDGRQAEISLPDVPDGDYLLRARVKSKVAESQVDMELPLYSPARVHVLSDRPIYEPGNVVQFRALALRARDLTPIDHRPGTWLVQDPQGEVLLEERSPAGEWGVAQGTFPLASDAEEGQWSVTWRSGEDEGRLTFQVVPFTLPRFRVEASAGKPFYGRGETPKLSGTVTYSSGAPVSGAVVEVKWTASGEWPPPSEWMAGGLPRQAIAADNGRFELVLPEVPGDLIGRATLSAALSAVDPAGDRVAGAAQVSLSADPIEVSLVTEFGGGLVSSTNNRVYLRVSKADGTVLAGARANVKRAWAPGDEGIDVELDEDGVGRVQLDPGRPVNVVIPAMPVRRQISASAGQARITGLDELVSQEEPPMGDRIELDRWLGSLEGCAKWVPGPSASTAQVALRVTASGSISHAAPDGTALGRCVAGVLRARSFPPGADRLYRLQLMFQPPDLPTLHGDLSQGQAVPAGLAEMVNVAALDARDCLPANVQGELPSVLLWKTTAGSKGITVEWLSNPAADEPMEPVLASCIASRVSARTLATEAEQGQLGLIRYRVNQPGVREDSAPQPTIMQGYELLVTAWQGDEEIGSTRVRVAPGEVPPLRLRATPPVAAPGDTIELALLRSAEHTGDLPTEIDVTHDGHADEIEVDEKNNQASFEIPEDAKGWYTFEAHGARALVFVKTGDELSLALRPGAQRYAPGAEARIDIETKLGDSGTKAAVGLFGVDQSLAQLATLMGPQELASVQPDVEMTEPAFGTLDAQALTLGRIRGALAAEATILNVATVPTVADLDVQINRTETAEFDAIAELTDNFYIVLAELYEQTRQWERSAKEGEQMTPPKMARLWKQAIKACEQRGDKVVDAYGRKLRLHRLPSDLLALTDPAQVVADAARLPEDTEPWGPWVEKEKP